MALLKLKKGASRLAYPPSCFPADFRYTFHLRHADGIVCNRASALEALNVRAKQMVVSMNNFFMQMCFDFYLKTYPSLTLYAVKESDNSGVKLA